LDELNFNRLPSEQVTAIGIVRTVHTRTHSNSLVGKFALTENFKSSTGGLLIFYSHYEYCNEKAKYELKPTYVHAGGRYRLTAVVIIPEFYANNSHFLFRILNCNPLTTRAGFEGINLILLSFP